MRKNKLPSCSIIVSTYNWPGALTICLKSILNQSHLPDEIIVADDGSTEETQYLVDFFKQHSPIPIIHVWQPDEGFQLAKIRNKAIAESKYDYIIQIDGDLILHPHFIRDHLKFALPGTFLTGSRVMLNKPYSNHLIGSKLVKPSILKRDIGNRTNGIRIPILSKKFKNYRHSDIYYVRGCNMSFWKKDLVEVNGYNCDFGGWGREDNELAARLIHNGIIKNTIKYSAIAFHLFHKEKPRTHLSFNDRLLQKTLQHKLQFAQNGIVRHI